VQVRGKDASEPPDYEVFKQGGCQTRASEAKNQATGKYATESGRQRCRGIMI